MRKYNNIFFYVGILLLVLSIGMFISETATRMRIQRNLYRVTAEIVSIEREVRRSQGRKGGTGGTYTVYTFHVEFEVDGQTISSSVRGWANPPMSAGMPVRLHVNRQNPYEFTTVVGANLGGAVFSLVVGGGVGIVFIFFGTRGKPSKNTE